jgi:uncharacterized membrane protein YgcG
MIRLFQTYTNRKRLSLKQFHLAFFICASVVAWIGISTIHADEVDPGDYGENTEVNFQNAAQEQHANNIAIMAALQDDEVTAAMRSGDDEAAKTEFEAKVAEFRQQISDRRAEGEGWGRIAIDLGVHPRNLGLGHYKNNAKPASQTYGSQNKDHGLALGHSKGKSGGHGFGQGGGNGHGIGNGNGNGSGGSHGGGKK